MQRGENMFEINEKVLDMVRQTVGKADFDGEDFSVLIGPTGPSVLISKKGESLIPMYSFVNAGETFFLGMPKGVR
jgi:hypothetical protein